MASAACVQASQAHVWHGLTPSWQPDPCARLTPSHTHTASTSIPSGVVLQRALFPRQARGLVLHARERFVDAPLVAVQHGEAPLQRLLRLDYLKVQGGDTQGDEIATNSSRCSTPETSPRTRVPQPSPDKLNTHLGDLRLKLQERLAVGEDGAVPLG